jgi:murein L,D-transpeptidase YcbB/YkuD
MGRWVVFVLLVSLLPSCHKVDNSRHVDGIRKIVRSTPQWIDRSALGRRLWTIERAFYESRGHLPAWIDGDATTPQLKDLLQQLHYAERHGLDPARYGVADFEQVRDASQTTLHGTVFPVERVPELDAKMTYAYLRYAADLLGWSSSPQQVSRDWLDEPRKDELAARLKHAIEQRRVRDTLEELAPTHPQYKGLQAALARERENPTGHIDQILMNLERWRWAPRDLGERYILINVPAYQLQVMEREKPVLAMRIIVGKPDTPTPLFSDEMTYIVFSPYWNIPESILRNEMLPRVVDNPDVLRRNNIEVVGTSGTVDPSTIDWSDESVTSGLHFRQAPGPENALGLVKFIFPNHFSIYLHDTPGDTLFFKPKRTFSHGCVRIENPVGLAEYVLRDQPQWTAERITSAMNAGREQTVKLKTTIPVHIGYWTAWVEPDGNVTYLDDPYSLDVVQGGLSANRPAASTKAVREGEAGTDATVNPSPR